MDPINDSNSFPATRIAPVIRAIFDIQYVNGTEAATIKKLSLLSPWPGAILVVCAEDSIGQKMAARTNIYLIWYTNIRARPNSRFT
jgi:hypothetical protein